MYSVQQLIEFDKIKIEFVVSYEFVIRREYP
jgi:hypothetical protein